MSPSPRASWHPLLLSLAMLLAIDSPLSVLHNTVTHGILSVLEDSWWER